MINIYNPDIKNYKKSALNAIEEGWISNHGKYIELANNKLKEITQAKYSILMANGTCTTHCLFLSIKFKYPNINKIYVPNNCYVAAWNSALMEYNINQLEVMKMNIDTWNISTNEEYINSLDKNCAVLIVHNLGNIINVPKLKKIRPDLIFVEDNCEGMFGKYENIYSGMSNSSLCSSCSFYGNKIITTGEGGAFFTQDEEVYNYIKCIYSQGMSDIKYLHKLHAYNYRMTNVQAGFLFDQLNDIDNILTNKYKIFENYNKLLKELVDLGRVQLMQIDEDTKNAPWIYALRIINNDKTIEETTQFFKDNEIDIRPFFYPINIHTHLKSIKNDDEISYKLNKEIIMIPSSPNITYEEQKKVVDTIYKFIWFLNNIKLIEVNQQNKNDIYDNFLSKIDSKTFRYFNKRNIDCLNNHIITFVLYDILTNKYIGYIHIDYDMKYWIGIYINEEYQNKKIGSLLLKYVLQHEKILKINEIYLSVDKNNLSAIKLYEKNNFKIIEEEDLYFIMKKLN
jgi:perosamine synthetase